MTFWQCFYPKDKNDQATDGREGSRAEHGQSACGRGASGRPLLPDPLG